MALSDGYSALNRSISSHEPSDEPSSTITISYDKPFSRATRSIHAVNSPSDSRSL